MLIEAVDKFPSNWKQISEFINTNKDEKDCYNRVHKLAGGSKIGKWTEEQDAKLYQLYLKYRNNWALIAKNMPGKSAK